MDLLRASSITVAHPLSPTTPIIRTWIRAELRRPDDFMMVIHLAVRLRLQTSGAGPCRRTQARPPPHVAVGRRVLWQVTSQATKLVKVVRAGDLRGGKPQPLAMPAV